MSLTSKLNNFKIIIPIKLVNPNIRDFLGLV